LKDGCDNVHLDEEILYKVLEKANESYFQSKQLDKVCIIKKTIELLEKVLCQEKNTTKLQQLEQKRSELRNKKQRLLEKLLDGVVSDADYQIQNMKFEESLCKIEKETQALCQQNLKKQDLGARLQEIEDNLEHGGFERVATRYMLDYVQKIVVHEWELAIIFNELTWYADIPFSPNTEKGRYLDQLHIMEILKSNSDVTVKMIADTMERSQYMVRNRMQELKKDGYISYIGVGGKGVWKIQKELPDIRKSKDLKAH
jgi:predicted HTH transcriptional regulator